MDASKKILISANTSWNIYNFRNDLLKLLYFHNFKINIISTKDNFTNKIFKKANFIHLNLKDRSLNPFFNVKLIFKTFSIFYNIKPDIILTYTFKSLLILNIVCFFFPKIRVINNISGLGSIFLNNHYIYFILKFFIRLAIFRSDHLIFQNDDDHIFIKKKFNFKRKKSVINGSGVDIYKFKKKERKKLNFLMIARLIKDKGVIEYIEAAKIIKNKFIDVNFILVGEYDHNNKSKIDINLINENIKKNNISYYNFDSEVIKFYIDSDCVILPSYREGTSKVLLEAASVGRPLIASNVPGCNNVVINNYNGYLCERNDVNSLVNSINKFIDTSFIKRKEMSYNSRKLVERNFDSIKINNQIIDVINA